MSPAHEMLVAGDIVRSATIEQREKEWRVRYVL